MQLYNRLNRKVHLPPLVPLADPHVFSPKDFMQTGSLNLEALSQIQPNNENGLLNSQLSNLLVQYNDAKQRNENLKRKISAYMEINPELLISRVSLKYQLLKKSIENIQNCIEMF
uniref:Uncharacterized protein n=1 Tax=Coptotermes formosanus TaxID=36987 RepID=R4UM59_COPFO|nr:hypothetical protein [Coptotermes formosanus]